MDYPKGQNNNQSNSYQSQNSSMELFNKDKKFSFIFKKAERFASALYLISNLFSDKEPLKWRIRSIASDLVTGIINVKDRGEYVYYESQKNLTEVMSLLQVGKASGLISQMNYDILDKESQNLISLFQEQGGLDFVTISNKFFETDKMIESPKETEEKRENVVKDILYKGQRQERENVLDKRDLQTNTFSSAPLVKKTPKKSYRKELIVNFLKKKDEATIKDIASQVRGCSEKTIQRELADLVNMGVLNKEGERRWTKYFLKS